MGVHYPYGYTGYESTFIQSIIDMLDRYCSCCHTNDDVGGDCSKCPIGNFIYSAKDYILKTNTKYLLAEEVAPVTNIQHLLKYIEPHPFFNGNALHNKHKDMLGFIRMHLNELESAERSRTVLWMIRGNITRHEMLFKERIGIKKNAGKKKPRKKS
jgi:hypothetical protein